MPFLETVSDFSESSRSALTAAAIFEKYLSDMIYSCNEESVSNLVGDLQPYEVRFTILKFLCHTMFQVNEKNIYHLSMPWELVSIVFCLSVNYFWTILMSPNPS